MNQTITAAGNSLLQYGAIGAVLAVLLVLFVWSFRVILTRFLRAFDKISDTLGSLVTSTALHTQQSNEGHKATMVAIHNGHQHITQRLTSLEGTVTTRHRRGTS